MPFRSVKCWFRASAEVSALVIALCAGTQLVESSSAFGMTVTAASKGGPTAVDGAIWYYGYDVSHPLGSVIFDPNSNQGEGSYGFAPVDVTKGQRDGEGNLDNVIEFNVYSAKNTGNNPSEVWGIVVSTTNLGEPSSPAHPVPIASVNGNRCSGGGDCRTGSIGTGQNDPGSGTYYYVVPYTGTTMRIGIYPRDVCTAAQALSANVAFAGLGCGTIGAQVANYITPTIPSTSPIVLSFRLQKFPNSNYEIGGAAVTGLATAEDIASLSLKFENGTRTALSCPSPSLTYFPGDQQIFMDLSSFSPTIQFTPAGFAPIEKVIVVGKESRASPDTAATFDSGTNNIVTRVGTGLEEKVGGFVNLTADNDSQHVYQVAVMGRDAAGVVTVAGTGAPPNGCLLDRVASSQIQGFLSKSNCFIATAAFRSTDTAPVLMLRQFRDQVLLRSVPGKSFVRWYYNWSPSAAEWLMLHPEFRSPVLHALIPLEIGAWLLIHPTSLMISLFATLGFLIWVLSIAIRGSVRSWT
jgi:hypothetical protein